MKQLVILSGDLVTLVKQQARLLALDENYPVVIVDGPPGIGCPVISAVSGADLAVIGHIPFDPTVTEAMVYGYPVTAFRPDAPASRTITAIWPTVVDRLEDPQVPE